MVLSVWGTKVYIRMLQVCNHCLLQEGVECLRLFYSAQCYSSLGPNIC